MSMLHKTALLEHLVASESINETVVKVDNIACDANDDRGRQDDVIKLSHVAVNDGRLCLS